MKKKTMYVKPLMEVIHVEENLLSGGSGKSGGSAGTSTPGGSFGGEAKPFSWDDDEEDDKEQSDNLFTGKSPWDGFNKQ